MFCEKQLHWDYWNENVCQHWRVVFFLMHSFKILSSTTLTEGWSLRDLGRPSLSLIWTIWHWGSWKENGEDTFNMLRWTCCPLGFNRSLKDKLTVSIKECNFVLMLERQVAACGQMRAFTYVSVNSFHLELEGVDRTMQIPLWCPTSSMWMSWTVTSPSECAAVWQRYSPHVVLLHCFV